MNLKEYYIHLAGISGAVNPREEETHLKHVPAWGNMDNDQVKPK